MSATPSPQKFTAEDVIDDLANHLDETAIPGLGLVLAAADGDLNQCLILETEHGDFRLRVTRLRT